MTIGTLTLDNINVSVCCSCGQLRGIAGAVVALRFKPPYLSTVGKTDEILFVLHF